MSGKPNEEGVSEVVGLLDRIAALDAEIAELKPQYERLRSAEVERSNAQIALSKSLKGMDLESRGNFGWEARLSWFLAEMRKQSARPSSPKDGQP